MTQSIQVALVSATLLLASDARASAQTVSLEPFRVVASNQRPALDNAVTADVTGDGIPDVLAFGRVQGQAPRLYLCEGLGSRAFAPAVLLQTPELKTTGPIYSVTGLEVADLDGDGDLDLAVVTADDRLLALRNDGTGTFDTPHPPSRPALQLDDVADADGDGALEVFITTPGERVEIGTLDPATWTFTFVDSGLDVASIRAADLDGDGRAEIITQALGIRVFPSIPGGYGAPITVSGISVFPFSTFSLVIDDLNGDGNLDLAEADTSGRLNAFLGDGSLGFTEVDLLPAALTSPALGTKRYVDANGDGALDLLYVAQLNGDPFNSTSFVSLGGGTLPFPEGTPSAPSFGPFAFAASEPQVFFQDVDGDGASDLVKNGTVEYGPFAGPPVGFQETGTFFDSSALESGKRRPRAIDVDGDGRLDLASINEPGRSLSWQRNVGALEFSPSDALSPAGVEFLDYAVGAFEAGRPDVLAEIRATPSGNELRVWRAAPGPGLTPSAPISTGAARVLGVVDLDGDGRSDVATTEGFHPLDASGNPGALVAAPAFSIPAGSRVEFDDTDGDGDIDLVTWDGNSSAPRSVEILVNTAGGQTFFGPSLLTIAEGTLALADTDGDGRTDIVQGRLGAVGNLEVRRNQGALSFGPPTLLASSLPPNPSAPFPLAIEPVDLDGDGDTDLAITPFLAQALEGQAAWLNEPGAPPTVSNFVSVFSKELVLGDGGFADLDGDGDLDAFDVTDAGSLLVAENALVPRTGTVFCEQQNANSSGSTGRLDAYGVPAPGGDPLRLVASRLPQGTFGIIVGSPTTAAPTPLVNSIGFLCLGPGIGRYSQFSEIGATGPAGAFELAIAPDDLRTGSTTVTAAAGLSWSFQAWHRDSFGSTGISNLTAGVTVTYQ